VTPKAQNGSDVLSIRNLTPNEISVKSAMQPALRKELRCFWGF
jgi:hypothetical protein